MTHRLRVVPELSIRRATDADLAEILAVSTRALGWDPTEPNEAFFRWKHLENPAGPSPMWVATDGPEGDIAGFRTMLRWRYLTPAGAELSAVRAVDTATHPDHQRKGVFRRLTTTAVDELTADGVDFVFNTPNAKSRAGYLRMGWRDAGRLAVRFTISGPRALARLGRARTAARKWSEPLMAGEAVSGLATDLAAAAPTAAGIATDRSADHLRWRYGFEPLHYRVVQTDAAAAIVRLRRRGPAIEGVVAEVMSPSVAATKGVLREVRRLPGVDHVLTLARPPHPAPWLPTVPGLGPRLTLRDLASSAPAAADLRFSLGDIELF